MQPVLVIGAGPAGAATAIFLRQLDLDVTIVEARRPGQLKIGESLPPDALALLDALGLEGQFRDAGHARCYCNQSIWGSSDIRYSDFLNHPAGHGWHIDRNAFEAMLQREARRRGADVVCPGRVSQTEWNGHLWNVRLTDGSEFQSAFLVDATGRNSWLARRQGIRRLSEDRQLALVAFLHGPADGNEGATLIEAMENGWWYSAPFPGGNIATAFMCNPDAGQRSDLSQSANWWALLAGTQQTAKRIDSERFALLDTPKFVAADSGMLERLYGNAWLAVGDAALTYDPVASHGILMAMVSARDAAAAVHACLQGDEDALPAYQETLVWAYRHYAIERRKLYLSENRFPESDYWRARAALD